MMTPEAIKSIREHLALARELREHRELLFRAAEELGDDYHGQFHETLTEYEAAAVVLERRVSELMEFIAFPIKDAA